MKLKQIPADFRVEEIATIVPGDGPFALYRLEKINWTTPDASTLSADGGIYRSIEFRTVA